MTNADRPRVRSDLGDLEGYHSAQVDVEVRLNTNESPLPPPEAWSKAVQDGLSTLDFHRYPSRQAWALREALAAHHGVSAEQIFCANGSNEVLQSLLLAYGGPGRTISVFEPTYQLHRHIARTTGTPVFAGRRMPDFSLDLREVERVVETVDPVLTFLCSPNNPSGGVDSLEEIRAVVAATHGFVVVDEAYGQFAPESALELLAEGEDRIIVVRTFSKTWSMAGVRLGYLVAAPDVVAACELVALPYHLDAFKQMAGRLALDYVDAMHERMAMVVAERERISSHLASLPVTIWPSQGNFVLFRPETMSAFDLWSALVDSSILVRDCSEWPGLEGCLRVTVGLPEENDRFLAALDEHLKER